MKHPLTRLHFLFTFVLTMILTGCQSPTAGPITTYTPGQAVHIQDKIVFNYRPTSTLVTPVHHVAKAKYAAIDIHCHYGLDDDPVAMLKAMDQRNVYAAVNLSGDWGKKLELMLRKYHGVDAKRFIIFCSIDFSLIDLPNFGQRMADLLTQSHRNGAAGLKIYKNLGLTIKDKTGKVVPVDDPRLDPIWQRAGELGMPVLIHSGDPPAFFEPLDVHNERWLQLARHPDWSFFGPKFPRRKTLMAQRNHVLAKHPGTQFIGAHVGSSATDLVAIGKLLDKYPNFSVDISGRVAELGRQPYAARKFMLQYQDQVLFGTDRFPGRPSQKRYRIYYRFLETEDQYFDYYDHPFPPAGEWKIYGIDLPDPVLEKVYSLNAKKLLGIGQSP